MSSAALLILVLAVFTVTGVTATIFSLIERLTRRHLGTARYTSELPTWGMMCREAMAREYVRANRRKPGLLLRGLSQARRDANEATPENSGEKPAATVSQRLPTNS